MKVLPLLILLALFLTPLWNAQAGPDTPDPLVKAVLHFGPQMLGDLAWRPDGQLLALTTHTGAMFFNPDFRMVDTLSFGYAESGWEITWSPTGDRLTAAPYSKTLCSTLIFERTSSPDVVFAPLYIPEDEYPVCGDLRWSRSGNRFAVLHYAGDYRSNTLTLVDKSSDTISIPLARDVLDFSWQSRGDQLAFITADQTLSIWQDPVQRITRRLPYAGKTVSWLPDDKQIITTFEAGDKSFESYYQPGFFIHYPAYTDVRFWDGKTQELVHQFRIENFGSMLTLGKVELLPKGIVGGECGWDDFEALSGNAVCLWSLSGDSLPGFSLGAGNTRGTSPIWSSDRHLFFWDESGRYGTSFRVGNVTRNEITYLNDVFPRDAEGIRDNYFLYLAWTPNRHDLTAIDVEGNVYQINVDQLKFCDERTARGSCDS